MIQPPFYDPAKTYEENYQFGPFGNFLVDTDWHQSGEPQYEYYGQKVFLPFGIPAGPLINSKYVKAAFEKGFDICVYKTVRSDEYAAHPFPNILAVHVEGDLTLNKLRQPIVADTHFHQPIAITNSFNIPSRKPEAWQEDMRAAIDAAGKGQVLVGSFVGTVRQDQTPDEFIEDWAIVAKLVCQTGVKIVEADISCPNNGSEGLVCYDLEITEKICKKIKETINEVPLILKVGYYEDDNQLEELAKIIQEYADGIAAINTLPGKIVDSHGDQALPGKMRATSGICGAPIKWAGISMTERLRTIREKYNYAFSIDGVGGVTTPMDYFEYIDAGANTVFSATGAMWNASLAQDIKNYKEL